MDDVVVIAPNKISIHALCEEGDPSEHPAATRLRNFYPRPLRGGRRIGFFEADGGI